MKNIERESARAKNNKLNSRAEDLGFLSGYKKIGTTKNK